jgi:ElaA protein
MDLRWRWLRWTELDRDSLHDLMVLRQRVFVVEQACAYLDADGRDPDAVHLLGCGEDDAVCAYLRAFPPDEAGAAWIGRVVTAPEVRGKGLGRPLMREGMRRVRAAWGDCPIRIGAQARLERFYASLGFAVCGEGYDEDGIPHLPMVRAPGR